MKLNPPLIGSSIPAFHNDGRIIVPFQMNPSVHKALVKGFSIKITNIINDGSSNNYIELSVNATDAMFKNNTAIFDISNDNYPNIKTLIIQNTYHLQLAYIDNNDDIGHYSTAALVKYTMAPEISITTTVTNNTFEGKYITEDLNEGAYKYQFIINDSNGNEFDNSGELIHDSSSNLILTTTPENIKESFTATISEPKGKNIVKIESEGDSWHQYYITQSGNYTFIPNDKVYIFSEEINQAGEYTYNNYYNNIIEGDNIKYLSEGLYILTKENYENDIPAFQHKSSSTLTLYNYIPNEIEVSSEAGTSCYSDYNSNNYPKVITLNNLLENDTIYITDTNIKLGAKIRAIAESYYKIKTNETSYSITVPAEYYIIVQKANGNSAIPTITIPNKLQCTDTFTTHKTYDPAMTYTTTYKMSSLNNLLCEVTSNSYEDNNIISPNEEFSLNVNYDRENGCVSIQGVDSNTEFIPGRYKLLRADSKNEYKNWTPIKSYQLIKASDLLFKDRTVEQGVGYKYAYQQFNNHGVCSSIASITSIPTIDFEYIYLGDKDRLIKLSFNSKVSSFKSTLFENKLDTLGGKYPFFFRNGDLNYKEFPITGLVSYLLDQDEFFMTRTQLGLATDSTRRSSTNSRDDVRLQLPTLNQVGYNFTAERLFRLELLDWLNNGEEKLFRSPTEGNYVVRLMNVSLTPNELLSRMIADFSATAYECGSADIYEMVAGGRLIDPSEQDAFTYHMSGVNINDLESNKITLNEGQTFERIKITGAFPGSTVTLYDKVKVNIIKDGKLEYEEKFVATYTIGQTGTLDATNLAAANVLTYTTTVPIGSIEYWVKKNASVDSDFDKITSVTVVNKAETFEADPTKPVTKIEFNNILNIYTAVFEPMNSANDATIKIGNGDTITLSGILSIDPSIIDTKALIELTNARVHFYYKCYNEVYLQDNEGLTLVDVYNKYITYEGGAYYV